MLHYWGTNVVRSKFYDTVTLDGAEVSTKCISTKYKHNFYVLER